MKPNDLYALPTSRAVPWKDAWRSFEAFFGEELEAFDAEASPSPDVVFAEKMSHAGDGERSIGIAAVLFEGRPIGCLLEAGRGRSDHEAAFATDAEGFARARRALDAVRRARDVDAVSPDEDLRDLDGYGQWVVVADGAGTRIVEASHLDGEGTPIFEEAAFARAVRALLQPILDEPDGRARLAPGLRSAEVRRLGARAILAAVAGHLAAVATPDAGGEDVGRDGWWPVRVTTGAGEHRVGVPATGLSGYLAWGDHVRVERIRGNAVADAGDPGID